MASSSDSFSASMIAVAVLALDALQVMQLGQQALAQIARADADGIHLP